MPFEKLKEIVANALPNIHIEEIDHTTPSCIKISAEHLLDVCHFLHSDPSMYFDLLSSITGIDNGTKANTIDVVYNLYSIPTDQHLMLRVTIARDQPNIKSIASVWKAAEWHEREAYDLLGIHFENHPDLRRILLPEDWEGFPLRKDYVEQEKYHDIVVKWQPSDEQ